MKTALVPGSFDPITLGHISIIERAAALFDKVIVCVMVNEQKKYLFLSIKQKRETTQPRYISDADFVPAVKS